MGLVNIPNNHPVDYMKKMSYSGIILWVVKNICLKAFKQNRCERISARAPCE